MKNLAADCPRLRFTVRCDLARVTNLFNNNNNEEEKICVLWAFYGFFVIFHPHCNTDENL